MKKGLPGIGLSMGILVLSITFIGGYSFRADAFHCPSGHITNPRHPLGGCDGAGCLDINAEHCIPDAGNPGQEPGPEEPEAERGELRATLLNLSPWQAWIHLYCQKPQFDATPCTVTFECNGMSGDPVDWTVDVRPKTIFSYWPNKTVNGTSANLQAALMDEGKTEEDARRRTTCEMFSPAPLAVRGYTLFGGQPTLVPVAVYE